MYYQIPSQNGNQYMETINWNLISSYDPVFIKEKQDIKSINTITEHLSNILIEPPSQILTHPLGIKICKLFQISLQHQIKINQELSEKVKKYEHDNRKLTRKNEKLSATLKKAKNTLENSIIGWEKCPICDKKFKSSEYLDNHINLKHNNLFKHWNIIRGKESEETNTKNDNYEKLVERLNEIEGRIKKDNQTKKKSREKRKAEKELSRTIHENLTQQFNAAVDDLSSSLVIWQKQRQEKIYQPRETNQIVLNPFNRTRPPTTQQPIYSNYPNQIPMPMSVSPRPSLTISQVAEPASIKPLSSPPRPNHLSLHEFSQNAVDLEFKSTAQNSDGENQNKFEEAPQRSIFSGNAPKAEVKPIKEEVIKETNFNQDRNAKKIKRSEILKRAKMFLDQKDHPNIDEDEITKYKRSISLAVQNSYNEMRGAKAQNIVTPSLYIAQSRQSQNFDDFREQLRKDLEAEVPYVPLAYDPEQAMKRKPTFQNVPPIEAYHNPTPKRHQPKAKITEKLLKKRKQNTDFHKSPRKESPRKRKGPTEAPPKVDFGKFVESDYYSESYYNTSSDYDSASQNENENRKHKIIIESSSYSDVVPIEEQKVHSDSKREKPPEIKTKMITEDEISEVFKGGSPKPKGIDPPKSTKPPQRVDDVVIPFNKNENEEEMQPQKTIDTELNSKVKTVSDLPKTKINVAANETESNKEEITDLSKEKHKAVKEDLSFMEVSDPFKSKPKVLVEEKNSSKPADYDMSNISDPFKPKPKIAPEANQNKTDNDISNSSFKSKPKIVADEKLKQSEYDLAGISDPFKSKPKIEAEDKPKPVDYDLSNVSDPFKPKPKIEAEDKTKPVDYDLSNVSDPFKSKPKIGTDESPKEETKTVQKDESREVLDKKFMELAAFLRQQREERLKREAEGINDEPSGMHVTDSANVVETKPAEYNLNLEDSNPFKSKPRVEAEYKFNEEDSNPFESKPKVKSEYNFNEEDSNPFRSKPKVSVDAEIRPKPKPAAKPKSTRFDSSDAFKAPPPKKTKTPVKKIPAKKPNEWDSSDVFDAPQAKESSPLKKNVSNGWDSSDVFDAVPKVPSPKTKRSAATKKKTSNGFDSSDVFDMAQSKTAVSKEITKTTNKKTFPIKNSTATKKKTDDWDDWDENIVPSEPDIASKKISQKTKDDLLFEEEFNPFQARPKLGF